MRSAWTNRSSEEDLSTLSGSEHLQLLANLKRVALRVFKGRLPPLLVVKVDAHLVFSVVVAGLSACALGQVKGSVILVVKRGIGLEGKENCGGGNHL